jgi:hypothetical protein
MAGSPGLPLPAARIPAFGELTHEELSGGNCRSIPEFFW